MNYCAGLGPGSSGHVCWREEEAGYSAASRVKTLILTNGKQGKCARGFVKQKTRYSVSSGVPVNTIHSVYSAQYINQSQAEIGSVRYGIQS